MTRLSVIIPIYNVEKYLRACLDSVIYPALEGYEILLVDDGSTDSSGVVAAEYAARHPGLIRLISKENGGLGSARNAGLAAAAGEYLIFLDSDDRLSPGALPEIMRLLDDGFDICFFDFVTLTEDGRQLKLSHGCQREGSFTLTEYPQLLFQPPNACMRVWRSSLFGDDIRFPGRLWFEDLYTTPKLYLRAGKMLSVHSPWYLYTLRSGSITNSGSISRNLDIITAVNQVTDYYMLSGCYEQYKNELEYMALYHQLITSTTRVNLIDRKSPVQDTLLEDYIAKFPHFRENPYVRSMSRKYKLLLFLITRRMRLALNIVMRLNNLIKGK